MQAPSFAPARQQEKSDAGIVNGRQGPAPFFKAVIQPKLTVNEPGDIYEQEADAMADKVMRMPAPAFFAPATPHLQRKCRHCEEEERKLHRKETESATPVATPALNAYVGSLSNGGQPLSESTRNFFEPRFGYDFSNVRVHNDSAAVQSAQSINALAYTSGTNIVFNQGQFAPESAGGKQLLAHELTHVVQQNGSGSSVQQKAGNIVQRLPGSAAGGCGVCYGTPMLAGRVAHAFIQEAFEAMYPVVSEHYILSVLPAAANFSGGFLDMAVLESVDQIAIGEIKPANADGIAQGTAKLALYQTALEALGMRVRRMDYPPPLAAIPFPTLGRGPACSPLQSLFVDPAVAGLYTYWCNPDYAALRPECTCLPFEEMEEEAEKEAAMEEERAAAGESIESEAAGSELTAGAAETEALTTEGVSTLATGTEATAAAAETTALETTTAAVTTDAVATGAAMEGLGTTAAVAEGAEAGIGLLDVLEFAALLAL